jgi:hypothetical protein
MGWIYEKISEKIIDYLANLLGTIIKSFIPGKRKVVRLTYSCSIVDDKSFIMVPYFDYLLDTLVLGKESRIQLCGIEGMGKSAVLRRLYFTFISRKRSEFSYIAFFNYKYSCEEMLKTPMIGMKDQYDPVFYLIEQAGKGKLLILVDDLTQSADKIDLSLLDSIEAVVVVASQYPIAGYSIIDVTKKENMLTTADCRKLFLQERYPDNSSEEISKEEIISLDRILNEKTASHYFVIKRLGAIARENGLSANELEMKLDKDGFRIFDTQENSLNDEISKLFQINKLPDQQKEILSVICYFPELLLGLNQWAKWLKVACNMTREECHKQLTKLTDNFWLIKENDLIRVYSVIAVAIQKEIPADNLVK